ncbi:hypothetical protein [Pseudofulvimonas gallinarii]|uniref:hypothetical protein n=1 Tax=Pseudofulvimonas gallinarii TaxID=634155 RepID=UPI0013DE7457|nr:hypothetical protein [Pseudofulvimonas gallinarii]
MTWYSYDDEGNQYWMLGVGSVDRQGNVVFPDMHSTRGGRFGANFDPDQVERFEWGRLSLDLSCEGGYAEYSSPLAGFGDGSFELSRLTRLRLLPCPYSWPAFTELYELHSFVELPIGDAEPFEPSIVVHAQHVANDGSVVASRRVGEDNVGWQKQIWKDGKWMVIPGLGAGSTHFSDAGDAIAVGRLTEEGEPWVFLWTWSEGWTPLSGLAYPEANVTASSRNLQYLGGSSMPSPSASRTVKWIWHAEEGVRVLPEPDDWGALPMLIRRDGRRVLGRGMRSQGSTARPVAVIWEGDDLPHEIKDASGVQLGFLGGCDELCEIVFGSDQTYIDAGHPKTRQAWYWRGAGDSGYLGRAPDDALIGQAPYTVNGVIADGTVAVGGYSRFVGNELTGAGFVWTQATGLVPLSEILASWQVELEWISMSVSDISANGEWMLLSGLVKFDNPLRYGYRAALLRIQPKSNEW